MKEQRQVDIEIPVYGKMQNQKNQTPRKLYWRYTFQ